MKAAAPETPAPRRATDAAPADPELVTLTDAQWNMLVWLGAAGATGEVVPGYTSKRPPRQRLSPAGRTRLAAGRG